MKRRTGRPIIGQTREQDGKRKSTEKIWRICNPCRNVWGGKGIVPPPGKGPKHRGKGKVFNGGKGKGKGSTPGMRNFTYSQKNPGRARVSGGGGGKILTMGETWGLRVKGGAGSALARRGIG